MQYRNIKPERSLSPDESSTFYIPPYRPNSFRVRPKSQSTSLALNVLLDPRRLSSSVDFKARNDNLTLKYLRIQDILPQSSGEFDPEADPELKKPPDPSESQIRSNFSKLCISIRTRIML